MLDCAMQQGSAASAQWQSLLGNFSGVDLEHVIGTATENRADTKFVLREEAVFDALSDLVDDYRVLDIDGQKFTAYRTQYFDTESYALFRRHHAGAANRYKIRSRVYQNTQQSFIEIKRKSRRSLTSKLRLETPDFETELEAPARAFIDASYPGLSQALRPSLRNRFERICLVSVAESERLTIDLNIVIENGGEPQSLPGIAIAEFKQSRNGHNHRDAAFLRKMRAMGQRPTAFSKYCMCLLLNGNSVKHNLFRPQLRTLRRLMGDPNVVC